MRSYAQAQAIHDRSVLAAHDADLVQLLARPRARRIRQWGQWAQLRWAGNPAHRASRGHTPDAARG